MSAAIDVPATCSAGVVVRFGSDFELKIEEVCVPEPAPEELLIRLNATGVCYSDLHYMMEDLPLPRMQDYNVRSPGHEGAGVVVKVGNNVKGWRVGDRAGIKPTWDTCMACELCWGNLECHCPNAVPTGLKVPGSYQQYIISPARYTTPIPDGVDDCSAGPIMCSGATVYRSLSESQLRPGDWAVIQGAGGGVGHMGVQLAKAMGLRVIGIDEGEEKKALCMELGCEAFIGFRISMDVVQDVLAITDGKGAHGVFVTATSASAYASATKMARTGGKIMCIGMPPFGTAFAGDDPMVLMLKGLSIIGTLTGSMKDTHEALKFAARGLLKPRCEVYSISDLPCAVRKLKQGKVEGRCVVVF